MSIENEIKEFNQLGKYSAEVRENEGFVSPDLTERAAEPRLKMRPIGELEPALHNRYLVKNWLDRGTASVVFGESNVGKTFFALDIAMHVAAGAAWCGNRAYKSPAPVFF